MDPMMMPALGTALERALAVAETRGPLMLPCHALGVSGIEVSALAFGGSALGGVFGGIDEAAGIAAVRTAIDAGINLFDVAPAYGATRAEAVLGRALNGIPRDEYRLSTKVGKYSAPDGDFLDYTAATIRAKLAESLERLGTDHLDMLFIHDIEYESRSKTTAALSEGLATALALKAEGVTRAVGFGFYPVDLWTQVLAECPIDVALIHNHNGLHDTRIDGLLPLATARGIGIIAASPFGSGLLTEEGAPAWHPATPADRQAVARAVQICRAAGSSISKLAFQFAVQRAPVATTLFSASDPASVRRCVQWAAEPFDPALVELVRAELATIIDRDWY